MEEFTKLIQSLKADWGFYDGCVNTFSIKISQINPNATEKNDQHFVLTG